MKRTTFSKMSNMKTEIEAKFIHVDPTEMRKRLTGLGAQLRAPERLMRRKNYDYPDNRLEKVGGWVRLRDEVDKITLAYKQLNDRTLHGTKEVLVVVEDFDKTADFLTAIGLQMHSYQETRRESWLLKGVEVEIDTWPWIPTFIEIEGKDEQTVRDTARDLGLEWEKAMYGSVENIYQEIFNVTEREVDAWDTITFSPIPQWLEKKRRG